MLDIFDINIFRNAWVFFQINDTQTEIQSSTQMQEESEKTVGRLKRHYSEGVNERIGLHDEAGDCWMDFLSEWLRAVFVSRRWKEK